MALSYIDIPIDMLPPSFKEKFETIMDENRIALAHLRTICESKVICPELIISTVEMWKDYKKMPALDELVMYEVIRLYPEFPHLEYNKFEKYIYQCIKYYGVIYMQDFQMEILMGYYDNNGRFPSLGELADIIKIHMAASGAEEAKTRPVKKLTKLKMTKFVDDGDEKKHKECGICFEVIKNGEDFYTLPCGHTFHPGEVEGVVCHGVNSWFKKKDTCPNCRVKIT